MGRGAGTELPTAERRGSVGQELDAAIEAISVPELLPAPPDPVPQRQVMLDVDSTLFPLLEAMRRLPGGENVRMERCHSWEELPNLCGSPEKMFELFDGAMSLEGMRAVGLLPGARAATHALRRHGVAVHVATQRPAELAEDTERFLRESGLHFESIACGPDLDKVELCREMEIPLLVDDHPEALRSAKRARIRPFALHWPYNEQVLAEVGALDHGRDWLTLTKGLLETIKGLVSYRR